MVKKLSELFEDLIKEEDEIVYSISIPGEDEILCEDETPSYASNAIATYSYPMVLPAVICEKEDIRDVSVGEKLCIDVRSRQMYVESADFREYVIRNRVRKKDRIKKRYVANGAIIDCIQVTYFDDGVKEQMYQIFTVDINGFEHDFEILSTDISTKLMSFLAEKGKIEILKQFKHDDKDVIASYVYLISKEHKEEFPYMPGWKGGKYLYAQNHHIIRTPFFRNVIKVEREKISERESLEKLLKIYEVIKNKRFRLFFMILSAYVVLQDAFPDVMKISVPFSISVGEKFCNVPIALLDFFDNSSGNGCSLTVDKEHIEAMRRKRMGTVVFFDNSNCNNRYYEKKAEKNLAYIMTTHDIRTVTVIVNKQYTGFIPGAFNITIRDEDIGEAVYDEFENVNLYLSRFLIGMAEWVSKKEVSLMEISKKYASIEGDEKVMNVIWDVLANFNLHISDIPLAQKIGYDSDEEVACEIRKICEERESFCGGDYVLNRLGEAYRQACIHDRCQRIKLKRDTVFEFDKDRVTFVEKDGLLCITEKDLKKLVEEYMEDLTMVIVKSSLKEADALELDKNGTFLKNVYIPGMNKTIRFLAIRKDQLKCTGEVEL